MAKPKTADERALRRKLKWYGGRGGPGAGYRAAARSSRQSVELPGMWGTNTETDLRYRFRPMTYSRARQYRRAQRLDAYVRSTYIELPMRAAQS